MKKLSALWRKMRGERSTQMALLLRVIQVVSGPVNSLLLVLGMSIEEQGIYYLFMGLLAVRIVFELGAATAIGQLAGHSMLPETSAVDPHFVVAVNRWMWRAALAMAAVTSAGGVGFLVWQGHGTVRTVLAWLLMVAGFAGGLCVEGRLSVLYGSGRLRRFFEIRLVNVGILVLGNWILLLSGAGLFSFGTALLLSLGATEYLCWKTDASLFSRGDGGDPEALGRHSGRIRGMLSKVSCVSRPFYLFANIQSMVCLHCLGASSLAVLGFVTSIGSSAIGMSSVWLHASLPELTALAAKQEYEAARRFYRHRLLLTLGGVAAGFCASVAAVWFLGHWERFSQRLPPWPVCLLVFGGISAQNVMAALVVWPRAFLLEPYGAIGIGQLVAMPFLMWVGALHYGVLGLAGACLAVWVLGLAAVPWKWPRSLGAAGTAGGAMPHRR